MLNSGTYGEDLELERVHKALQAMITARVLEDKLSSLYKAGKIVGGVYVGRGQEAVSATLAGWMDTGRDIFAPLIRDQAGRCAFGEDLLDATRTYLGSVLGPMRGRDGNVHRGRPREGTVAMISHLGGALSVVSGMLFARKLKGVLGDTVGATCLGDGATSTGAFHEGLNTAAIEKLPLVVVVANNQFAYSTPNEREFACRSLADKAIGYGVQGHEVQGNDFRACWEVMGKAVKAARSGAGPQLVVAELLRLCGHGEHDDASYIPKAMRESELGRDCLDVAQEQATEAGWITQSTWNEWLDRARELVQKAVATAQQEPPPDALKDDWRARSLTRWSSGSEHNGAS